MDWSGVEHAYGPATDVPGLIEQLAQGDPDAQEAALLELFGNIHHQGTVYEATAPAVPLLFAALPVTGQRTGVIGLLDAIANGSSYHATHAGLHDQAAVTHPDYQAKIARETAWVQAARDAVCAGLDAVRGWLTTPDRDLRRAVVTLLGSAGAPQDLLRLQAVLETERDPLVLDAMVEALWRLDCADGVLFALVEREGCTQSALLALFRRGVGGVDDALREQLACDLDPVLLDGALEARFDLETWARVLGPLVQTHGLGAVQEWVTTMMCTWRGAPEVFGQHLVDAALAGDAELTFVRDEALAAVLEAIEEDELFVPVVLEGLCQRSPEVLPHFFAWMDAFEDEAGVLLESMAPLGDAVLPWVDQVVGWLKAEPYAARTVLLALGPAAAGALQSADLTGLPVLVRASLEALVLGRHEEALELLDDEESAWWVLTEAGIEGHEERALASLTPEKPVWERTLAATYLLRSHREEAVRCLDACLEESRTTLDVFERHGLRTPALEAFVQRERASDVRRPPPMLDEHVTWSPWIDDRYLDRLERLAGGFTGHAGT